METEKQISNKLQLDEDNKKAELKLRLQSYHDSLHKQREMQEEIAKSLAFKELAEKVVKKKVIHAYLV